MSKSASSSNGAIPPPPPPPILAPSYGANMNDPLSRDRANIYRATYLATGNIKAANKAANDFVKTHSNSLPPTGPVYTGPILPLIGLQGPAPAAAPPAPAAVQLLPAQNARTSERAEQRAAAGFQAYNAEMNSTGSLTRALAAQQVAFQNFNATNPDGGRRKKTHRKRKHSKRKHSKRKTYRKH